MIFNSDLRVKETSLPVKFEIHEENIKVLGTIVGKDLENLKIVDYDPHNVVLSVEERQKRYEMYVEELIRKKYTLGQELAILR